MPVSDVELTSHYHPLIKNRQRQSRNRPRKSQDLPTKTTSVFWKNIVPESVLARLESCSDSLCSLGVLGPTETRPHLSNE